MTIQRIDANQWFSLVESQVNKKTPERLELILGLRARFGHLLRESIVSVMLEFDGQQYDYVIRVAALGEALSSQAITHHLPDYLLNKDDPFEWQSLLPIAEYWINSLDNVDVACESELFTQQSLALIGRVSNHLTDLSELEKAEKAQAFFLSIAQEMANEYAPAIREKVETAVRKKYQSRPGNNMIGDECETEWQELGAMLLDGTHLLLETGIHQLRMTISSEIAKLRRQDRLALWLDHCEYIADFVSDHTPDDTFDLMQDSYALEEIVESITSDLQTAMVWDWENQLSERDNYFEQDSKNISRIASECELKAHAETLKSIIDGAHDSVELNELLDRIDAASQALIAAGLVTDHNEYDQLIGKAATKWAELDLKYNG